MRFFSFKTIELNFLIVNFAKFNFLCIKLVS